MFLILLTIAAIFAIYQGFKYGQPFHKMVVSLLAGAHALVLIARYSGYEKSWPITMGLTVFLLLLAAVEFYILKDKKASLLEKISIASLCSATFLSHLFKFMKFPGAGMLASLGVLASIFVLLWILTKKPFRHPLLGFVIFAMIEISFHGIIFLIS